MSVKIEKLSPQPAPPEYKVTGIDLYPLLLSEEKAREIYDGLAGHFAPQSCSTWKELAEKDAEIARLQEKNASQFKIMGDLSEDAGRLKAGEERLIARYGDKIAEVERLKERLKEQKKYNADQVMELVNAVNRLKGWIRRWQQQRNAAFKYSRKFPENTELDRALAGEEVPE